MLTGRSHTALKVAVAGTDADLARLQETLAKSDTRPAPSRERLRAGLEEGLPVARGLGSFLFRSRSRCNVELDPVGHFGNDAIIGLGGVLENLSRCRNVRSTTIGARNDVCDA